MMVLSVFAVLLAGAAPPDGPAGGARAAAVSRFVSEEVAVVACVDLGKIDIPALARRTLGKAADDEDTQRATRAVAGFVDTLRAAGAKHLYVLLDPADMPGVPIVVVPLAQGADAAAITGALSGNVLKALGRAAAVATIRDAVVAAAPDALERLRAATPSARPGLADALAVGSGAAVQVVLIPSSTQRRALEESVVTLPPQLGGGPITTLTHGLRWASLAFSTEPRATIHAVFRANDQAAASAVQRFLVTVRDLAADAVRKDPTLTELVPALSGMQPSVSTGDVTLDADLEKTAALVMVPVRLARESARRSQCSNNLKQIALAMHNYHSSHNSFPAAYSTSKDGKPLLSWRVHLLPFLDSKGLYDRFHLDEPWDSPHNRSLIAEMPLVYACPSGSRALAREGRTTYLTPRGPTTMFPGAEPVVVKDVTDGTSNTIMAGDVGDARAVVWTRPEDWEIGGEPVPDGLFGHHVRGTNFAFGDGSVRFVKESVAPNVLRALLTRNGGEVVNADAF